MPDRHWVMIVNENTDECRFIHLLDEWLPFKYNSLEDIQPCWNSIGFYETLYDAYSAIIDL